MMCNNFNLYLVNIIAYTNLVKICHFVLKILSGSEILAKIKGHNSGANEQKMACNNPNLDLVNINLHKKFGKTLSFYSQGIERK